MTEQRSGDAQSAGPDGLAPLPGEPGIPSVTQRARSPISRKGLLSLGVLLLAIVGGIAFTVHRFAASGKKGEDDEAKLASQRPTAASSDPRRLDLLPPPPATPTTGSPVRVPALIPTADEAEPIGVRRTGTGAPPSAGTKGVAPEDAPVLLVTTRPGVSPRQNNGSAAQPVAAGGAGQGQVQDASDSNDNDPVEAASQGLQAYQRQLQGLLNKLTQSAGAVGSPSTGGPLLGAPALGLALGGPQMGASPAIGVPSAGGGLFGGQLQGSATPRVVAGTLGNRSLMLPKGTAFTCALKTRVISATSGLIGCQVQRNVFSDDGRVLLIERGSHLDGEYRIASVRPGTVRIPVLWTRIRTPLGVTVDVDSPGTGQLGESGIDGHVDNRWGERIGAAMLLSLIDDSVKLVIQNQSSDTNASTVVLPSTTANTSKLAEKVLDSTINIPPLIYQNQGGIVGIYVARDVDFAAVYELRPVERDTTP